MKKYEMPEILEEVISFEDAILASIGPDGWEAPDQTVGIGGIL